MIPDTQDTSKPQSSPGGCLLRLVRPLLAPAHRHRVHGICRLPKGYTLLSPFEKITPGCKFTRPTSPKWVDCMVGEVLRDYDPEAYFIHARPNEKLSDSHHK